MGYGLWAMARRKTKNKYKYIWLEPVYTEQGRHSYSTKLCAAKKAALLPAALASLATTEFACFLKRPTLSWHLLQTPETDTRHTTHQKCQAKYSYLSSG